MKIIKNYLSEECVNVFTHLMISDKPCFFSRIGGSDWDSTYFYFNNKNLITDEKWCKERIEINNNYNGYFDFDNKIDNYQKYLESMILFYKNSDSAFYAGKFLIDQIDNDKIKPMVKNYLDYIIDEKLAINYGFIENVRPFLKSFQYWGKNKKILIISPLSKSVEYQYKNINNLYFDYKFPHFYLKTYNTKITYNNKEDTRESLNINTTNWHEECNRMAEEIKQIDFDIALLSCASYGMFLGNYIKQVLNKKSIYLGGILNVYFNIYGNRYNNNIRYTRAGLNLQHQIEPFENDDIINIKGGREVIGGDSLNAYFGKRK